MPSSKIPLETQGFTGFTISHLLLSRIRATNASKGILEYLTLFDVASRAFRASIGGKIPIALLLVVLLHFIE
jgi:hypothetical protein